MKRDARIVCAAVLLGFGIVLSGCSGGGDPAASGTSGRVVAEVGANEVSAEQLLERLERDQFDLVRDTLDNMIAEQLLEQEALTRGTTVDELIATEVQAKIAEPTEDEVRQFYEGRRDRMGGQKLEQLAPQIANYLHRSRAQQRHGELLAELRAAAGSRVYLEPPRFDIALPAEIPARGPQDAPVTIVEFADFECPACRSAYPDLQRVLEEYGDDIRFVFRDFPLPNHSRAIPAAEAAYCADEQGQFWAYHSSLMSGQGSLDDEGLADKAASLGLDVGEFRECYASKRHAGVVRAAFEQGRQLGVDSTPTLFINGRRVVGAQNYDVLRRLVEEELARAES